MWHIPFHPGAVPSAVGGIAVLQKPPGSGTRNPNDPTVPSGAPRLEVARLQSMVGKIGSMYHMTWDVTYLRPNRVRERESFEVFLFVIFVLSWYNHMYIYAYIPWIQHLSTNIKRSKFFAQNIPKLSLWKHITLPHLRPSSFSKASCKTCCSCSGNSLMAWLGCPTRARSYYVKTVFVWSAIAMHLSQVKT